MPLALWREVIIMIYLLIQLIFLEHSVYDSIMLGSWDSLRQKKKSCPQGFYNLTGKPNDRKTTREENSITNKEESNGHLVFF